MLGVCRSWMAQATAAAKKRLKPLDHTNSKIAFSPKKKRKIQKNWTDLPTELLELIAKRLGTIDFIMFGRVCMTWRLCARACTRAFMASQPPLLLLLPKPNSNICYFREVINNNRLYKTTLPFSTSGLSCLGFSCGFLIFQEKKPKSNPNPNFWVFNPFTRHCLRFPHPGKNLSRVIVSSNSSELVLVGFKNHSLYFCRSSDCEWTVCKIKIRFYWRIMDVTIFKKKLYVLSSCGKLRLFDTSSSDTKLKLVSTMNRIRRPCLVVSSHYKNHLLVANSSGMIYSLNWTTMVWKRVVMTDFVLFMYCSDHYKNGGVHGMIKKPNLGRSWSYCYPEDDGVILNVAGGIGMDRVRIKSDDRAFWCFPHLSTGVVDVIDIDQVFNSRP